MSRKASKSELGGFAECQDGTVMQVALSMLEHLLSPPDRRVLDLEGRDVCLLDISAEVEWAELLRRTRHMIS